MNFIEPILTHEDYEKLNIETLGEYIPHTQHNIIVCKEDEKVVAIFNYFPYDVSIIFLHQCWFSPEYQKKIKKLKYWVGFYDYIKTKGYKYIMGVIYTENTPALIWALKTGFKITGTRQSIDKSLIVDIIKEL
jgi:hypothetical protein